MFLESITRHILKKGTRFQVFITYKNLLKLYEANIESQTIGLIKELIGELCSMSIWEDLGLWLHKYSQEKQQERMKLQKTDVLRTANVHIAKNRENFE